MNLYPAKTYLSRKHPFAYATITNFEKGQGLLVIHSDWGTYSAYWPAIGDQTLEEFILGCEPSYLEGCLRRGLHFLQVKKEGFRCLDKFIIECWPNLKNVIQDEMSRS
jgi:hypothetical protein